MSLSDYGEWVTLPRATNVLWSSFCAAIVHEDDFEIEARSIAASGIADIARAVSNRCKQV